MITQMVTTVLANGRVLRTFTYHQHALAFATAYDKKHPDEQVVLAINEMNTCQEELDQSMKDFDLVEWDRQDWDE